MERGLAAGWGWRAVEGSPGGIAVGGPAWRHRSWRARLTASRLEGSPDGIACVVEIVLAVGVKERLPDMV